MSPTAFWLLMLLASVLTLTETTKRRKAQVFPKGKKTDSKLSNLDGREACNKLNSILHW